MKFLALAMRKVNGEWLEPEQDLALRAYCKYTDFRDLLKAQIKVDGVRLIVQTPQVNLPELYVRMEQLKRAKEDRLRDEALPNAVTNAPTVF